MVSAELWSRKYQAPSGKSGGADVGQILEELRGLEKKAKKIDADLVKVFMQMGLNQSMLQRNQKLIDQFNRDEQCRRRLRWRKLKRRVRFPKLGALRHTILDLRDEMRERRRPADCVSRKWKGGQ